MTMNEQDVRAAWARDPREGHQALFDAYFHYVFAIAHRILTGIGTQEDMEECVADTMADVMQHFGDIRDGSLKAYIGTVARHHALNTARALGRHPTVSLDEEERPEPTDPDRPDAIAEDAAQRRILIEQIQALGEPDSAILLQKYWLGRDSREIAASLGLTPANVRKRCERAVKRLRKALADADIW